MKKLRLWLTMCMAGLAMVGFALVACGGDDDDDDGGSDPFGGSSSGDDSGSGDSGGANPTGADEKYVATICKASLEFQKALEKSLGDVQKDPSKFEDEKEVAKVFVGPIEDYLKAVEKASPPKDVKKYHDDVVKTLKELVDRMKKADDVTSVFSDEAFGELPEAPQAVQDRLTKASQNNKDCTEAGFDFSE